MLIWNTITLSKSTVRIVEGNAPPHYQALHMAWEWRRLCKSSWSCQPLGTEETLKATCEAWMEEPGRSGLRAPKWMVSRLCHLFSVCFSGLLHGIFSVWEAGSQQFSPPFGVGSKGKQGLSWPSPLQALLVSRVMSGWLVFIVWCRITQSKDLCILQREIESQYPKRLLVQVK